MPFPARMSAHPPWDWAEMVAIGAKSGIVVHVARLAGLPEPVFVNGIQQKPYEGVSMAYTFDKANADAPSTRKTQYFEMFCNRGIYSEGWYACARHGRLPWTNAGSAPLDEDVWELYNIEEDFSQANDLAAKNPEKIITTHMTKTVIPMNA